MGTGQSPPGAGGRPDGTPPPRADARRNRARILAAASEVFAAQGASATTEQVARRAGVAIGTVFRHFPTKDDLLAAMMKDLLEQLSADVAALARNGDPRTALFSFFTRLVAQAAAKKSVVELLSRSGLEIQAAQPLQALRGGIDDLLTSGQRSGAIREDAQVGEVMALLASTCQGAFQAGWDDDLQRRALTVIFDGLRPPAGPTLRPSQSGG